MSEEEDRWRQEVLGHVTWRSRRDRGERERSSYARGVCRESIIFVAFIRNNSFALRVCLLDDVELDDGPVLQHTVEVEHGEVERLVRALQQELRHGPSHRRRLGRSSQLTCRL